jgi:hypothetical protein
VSATVVDDKGTVTVKVPISIRRRGGHKLVLAPAGAHPVGVPIQRRVDSAIVKAIARAFRWRDCLESGEYPTIREIAAAEKINESYVSRVLRLTLLAPEIVEGVLNGTQSDEVTLGRLMKPFPIRWYEQRSTGCSSVV